MLKLKNKQFITVILCFVMLVMSFVPAFCANIIVLPDSFFDNKLNEFSDVGFGHWFYEDVMIMARRGYIQGTTELVDGVGIFEPYGNVTLGQFLTIAARVMNNEKDGKSYTSHWASKYYDAAIKSGIISTSDFSEDEKSLDTPLTREDMAYILVNIAKKRGESLTVTENIEYSIVDLDSVSSNRREAVKLAYSSGLLTGKDNYEFKPFDLLTRAETATVFCRILNFRERPKVVAASKEEVEYYKYVVRGEGSTQGLIRAEYARQFDLQALDNIRIGEDATGVYFEFTAPDLPDILKEDFVFAAGSSIYEPGAEVPIDIVSTRLESGGYFKGYFMDWEENYVKKERIDGSSVSLTLLNKTLLDSIVSHTVYIFSKTQAIEHWDDDNKFSSIIEYDSTHIYSGIGR